MNVYVLVLMFLVRPAVSMLVLLMGEFMKETFGLLSPPPLPHRAAHQAGGGEVEHTPGSHISELRHTDGISSSIADQLVNGIC